MSGRHDTYKSGGVLLGLVVAMVAVSVLSAAMVKSLRSQSVSTAHAYNLMRARYAAESGYNYFISLSGDDRLDLVGNSSAYTLLNGDQFRLNVGTNTTHLFVEVIGNRVADGRVTVASRSISASFVLSGSDGDLSSDDESPEVVEVIGSDVPDEVGSVADIDASSGLADDSDDLKPAASNNKDKEKHKLDSYNSILATHTSPFVSESLPTFYSSSEKLKTELDIRYAELDEDDDTHMIWSVPLPLNYSAEAAVAWTNNSEYLAYDIQAKFSWQQASGTISNRYYGASGLAFKLHGSAADGYQFYALTLMRFKTADEDDNVLSDDSYDFDIFGYADGGDANLTGYSSADGYWADFDCLPNNIKPSGMDEKYLLVLWKQWIEDEETHRTWLAYQDLSALDEYVESQKDNDGVVDVTLGLRVLEGTDSGGDFFDVQTYLGDCIVFFNIWRDHVSPYDRDQFRWTYPNADDLSELKTVNWWISWNRWGSWYRSGRNVAQPPADDYDEIFPSWPSLSITNWTSSADFFTVIEEGQQTGVQGDDSFLGNLDSSQGGVTLRIHDSDFLFENQSEQIGDIGFVFAGNFLSGMDAGELNRNGKLSGSAEDADIPSLYMAADDFAVRWLTTSGGEASGTTGSDSSDAIITDF